MKEIRVGGRWDKFGDGLDGFLGQRGCSVRPAASGA